MLDDEVNVSGNNNANNHSSLNNQNMNNKPPRNVHPGVARGTHYASKSQVMMLGIQSQKSLLEQLISNNFNKEAPLIPYLQK